MKQFILEKKPTSWDSKWSFAAWTIRREVRQVEILYGSITVLSLYSFGTHISSAFAIIMSLLLYRKGSMKQQLLII